MSATGGLAVRSGAFDRRRVRAYDDSMIPAPELKDAERLLSELVACPSVNPSGAPHAGRPYGEAELQHLLGRLLGEWGARTTMAEVMPGRYNLIARFAGRDSGRSLMLEAHADTVDAEHMAVAAFDPVVENGRLYGRGSCDTKGAMASMLLGIRAALDADATPPVDLYFVATCGEERGAQGAHALMEGGFRPTAAVVGEPTDLALVNLHKGALRWRVTTLGKAAHSSDPTQGINAISLMARVIQRIDGTLAPALAQRSHPLLGPPVISVGLIRGGTQPNTVPARCEIDIDRRLLPSETRESAHAEIVRELDEMARQDARFRYEIAQTEWYPPMEEDPNSPVAEALSESCRKVLGAAAFRAAPYGTNGGIFKHHGVPSVVFGPGSARQAHTADEYVELEQVAMAARVYADLVRTFGV